MLQSVPELADAHIVFNSIGDCLFALYPAPDDLQMFKHYSSVHHSSFRTFDGFDYSPIATIDVKKKIYDISIDPKCNYISLIESHKSVNKKICSGYEIGRGQDDDDTDDDDDDDDNDEDDDDDDDREDYLHDWNDDLSNSTFSISEFSLRNSDDSDDVGDDEDDDEDEESDEEDDYDNVNLYYDVIMNLDEASDEDDDNTRYSLS